jgi:hypothetical protein
MLLASTLYIRHVLIPYVIGGLVVVGDINIAGPFEEEEKDGKGKGKGKWKGTKRGKDGKILKKLRVEGINGQVYWTKAIALRNIYTKLYNSGRVARATVPLKDAAGSAEAADEAGPSTEDMEDEGDDAAEIMD